MMCRWPSSVRWRDGVGRTCPRRASSSCGARPRAATDRRSPGCSGRRLPPLPVRSRDAAGPRPLPRGSSSEPADPPPDAAESLSAPHALRSPRTRSPDGAEHRPARHALYPSRTPTPDGRERPPARHAPHPSRSRSTDALAHRPDRWSSGPPRVHAPDAAERPSVRRVPESPRGRRSDAVREPRIPGSSGSSEWCVGRSTDAVGRAASLSVPRAAWHPCRAAVCPGSVPKRAAAGASQARVVVRRRGGGSGSGTTRPRTYPGGRSRPTRAAGAVCPGRRRPADSPRCRASAARLRSRARPKSPCHLRRVPRAAAEHPRSRHPVSRTRAAHAPASQVRTRRRRPARAAGPGSRAPRRRHGPTAYPSCPCLPCPRTPRTALVRSPPRAARGASRGEEEWRRGALPCSCTPRFLGPGDRPAEGSPPDPFPACVRVTLRVDAVRVGTSRQARGICPERPPTLR